MTIHPLFPQSDLSLFDQFWASYPHKRGKGDARKAWKQVDGDAHFNEIMAGIPPYIAEVARVSWLNYKHPAGWLRQEYWENEYEAAPQVESKAADFLQRRADMKRLSSWKR